MTDGDDENTPLAGRIRRLIALNGPLSLADYMALCLSDPRHGYYPNRQAIGAGGDFVTAPEISQMFGELVGVWCVSVWHALGRPSPFCLAEAGPGHGTLMRDLLRAAAIDREFLAAARIVLIENSPAMRGRQQALLSKLAPNLEWKDSVTGLPPLPLILVANEFLDALPFRQYVRQGQAWRETGVGIDGDGRLVRVALPGQIDPVLLPQGAAMEPEGSVFERSPAREAAIAEIAGRLAKHSGAGLVFDYGHLRPGFGDTFQGVRNHLPEDPLASPGLADLTSHVDFSALVQVLEAEGISASATTTQGQFLLAMGLVERAGALGANAGEAAREMIRDAVERLAGPAAMGNLFKVLAFSNPPIPFPGIPPGPAAG